MERGGEVHAHRRLPLIAVELKKLATVNIGYNPFIFNLYFDCTRTLVKGLEYSISVMEIFDNRMVTVQ